VLNYNSTTRAASSSTGLNIATWEPPLIILWVGATAVEEPSVAAAGVESVLVGVASVLVGVVFVLVGVVFVLVGVLSAAVGVVSVLVGVASMLEGVVSVLVGVVSVLVGVVSMLVGVVSVLVGVMSVLVGVVSTLVGLEVGARGGLVGGAVVVSHCVGGEGSAGSEQAGLVSGSPCRGWMKKIAESSHTHGMSETMRTTAVVVCETPVVSQSNVVVVALTLAKLVQGPPEPQRL